MAWKPLQENDQLPLLLSKITNQIKMLSDVISFGKGFFPEPENKKRFEILNERT